jgi:hypothetical protein
VSTLVQNLHSLSNSSQQPTNQYNGGGDTQHASEGSSTLTLTQLLVEDAESENRVIGSDLERDMLLAFEEQEGLLSTTNPGSRPS